MNEHILINPDHPGNYYAGFYLLAFLVGFFILMRAGHKKGFDTIPWMMVIATAFLFFMIGCRVIVFSREEWGYVLRLQRIPYATGLSTMGGILFIIPALLAVRKYIQFKSEILDSFAFVLPAGIMIERIGCLMAGCCYGTLSDLPWSVQYNKNSIAFAQQIHQGLLSGDAVLSLPLHPVQIYEVLGCIVIVIVLWQLRKVLRVPGNQFLASVGLYAFVRFVLEFVRSGRTGESTWGFGLDALQWIILLVLPLAFIYIIFSENKFTGSRSLFLHVQPESNRALIYFFILIGSFLFISRWLTPLEIVAFNIVLLPMLLRIVWQLFTRATVPGYRLIPLVMIPTAFILMSQTLPEYSKRDSRRLSYTMISAGWMGGSNDLTYQGSCGGTEKYDHGYSGGAIGVSHMVQLGKDRSILFGINGMVGSHRSVGGVLTQDIAYSGIKPFVQYDMKRVGIGAGFNYGQFGLIAVPLNGSAIKEYSFYPAFSFRYGNLSKAFIEYRYGNQFPTSFPAMGHLLTFGIGFEKYDGSAIRFGTGSYTSFYIAPSIAAGKHFIIEPLFGFGRGFNSYSDGGGVVGSISLHYKLDRKEKPVN